MPTLPPIINKQAVFVLVIGGSASDGFGWGITPSGKLKKIPDNNPGLRKLTAAQAVLTRLDGASPDADARTLLDAAKSTLGKAANELAAGLE